MRAEGFYWVMTNGRWIVGEFGRAPGGLEYWDIPGTSTMYKDADLQRIGNMIPLPPSTPACVEHALRC